MPNMSKQDKKSIKEANVKVRMEQWLLDAMANKAKKEDRSVGSLIRNFCKRGMGFANDK